MRTRMKADVFPRILAVVLTCALWAASGASANGSLPIQPIASPGVPHNGGGAAACEGKIYLWTGYSDIGAPQHYNRTPKLEVYDPVTESWDFGADIPGARNSPGAFELNGKLYSVGGERSPSGNFTNTVYRYDPGLDAWSTMDPFPVVSHCMLEAVCNGKAFLFGGRRGYGATYPNIWRYEEATDSWTPRAGMAVSVMHSGVAAHDGKIYVFGGVHKESEAHHEYIKTIQVYDSSANSWQQVGETPVLLQQTQAVVYEDGVFLFSNKRYDPGTSQWVANDQVHRYASATGQWTSYSMSYPSEVLLQNTNNMPIHEGYAYLLGDDFYTPSAYRVSVPGPATLSLLAVALGLLRRRRRRR